MTHIAIQESLDGKAVDRLEKVTDEQSLKAATAARPKVRYTAGGTAGRLRLLRTFLPALMDAGIRQDFRLDAFPATRRGAAP